jgi:hypothetical protein
VCGGVCAVDAGIAKNTHGRVISIQKTAQLFLVNSVG